MQNDLLQLALRRRSVRTYGSSKIQEETIREILKVALTAPSSFGHNPVEFVVVRDKARIEQIGSCKRMGGSQINGADTVVIVMVRTKDKRDAEFWIEDGAIASTYLLLAAEQYDIGACWVHIRNRQGQVKTSDEEIRALVGVPDGYTILNLVALGEKAEVKQAHKEDDIDFSKVHTEKY
ncbi:nitroreductase family protein [Robinsoniella peoriensis]|uniref:nitroreductase family protein n=1 Tax=Robinsoniella peoriensis TaxID=180332 RepID=UPI00085BBEA4|nr:nitroreductase family protein [Robinsoniella peoriensis]